MVGAPIKIKNTARAVIVAALRSHFMAMLPPIGLGASVILRNGRLLALIAGVALPTASSAQTVVDGDTIRLGGTSYSLWGVDAAETQQVCADGWPAGIEAADAIAVLIHGHVISCDPKMRNREGDILAMCLADGADLAAAMVLAGHALVIVRDGRAYLAQEAVARAAKRGIHAHDCEKPWDYRARVKGER
jgi:endonuclease YncB( thermonuclease family)